MIRCPNWLYRWIDRRGRIPWFVRLLWPTAHWCLDMDALLVIDNFTDCYCGRCRRQDFMDCYCWRCRRQCARYERKFYAAVKKARERHEDVPF